MLNFFTVFGLMLLSTKVFSEPEKSQPFNINFQQTDYEIKFEHMDIVHYDKKYVKHATTKTFKFNRTCTAFNVSLTFNIDMGNNFELTLQAYRFASNEYRLFPMRFEFNVCDAVTKNAFGFGNLKKCGNLLCPFKKDTNYIMCNFVPDTSRFPPLIPNGRYMMEFQAFHLSVEFGVFQAFMEISRPFTGF